MEKINLSIDSNNLGELNKESRYSDLTEKRILEIIDNFDNLQEKWRIKLSNTIISSQKVSSEIINRIISKDKEGRFKIHLEANFLLNRENLITSLKENGFLIENNYLYFWGRFRTININEYSDWIEAKVVKEGDEVNNYYERYSVHLNNIRSVYFSHRHPGRYVEIFSRGVLCYKKCYRKL